MAKAAKKKAAKPRKSEYEKKVSFDGTFEEMIAISVKQAKKGIDSNKNNDSMDINDRYKLFYNAVEKAIKRNLLEVASISINKNDSNIVDVEFIIHDALKVVKPVKKQIDLKAKEFGFTINYINLSGDFQD